MRYHFEFHRCSQDLVGEIFYLRLLWKHSFLHFNSFHHIEFFEMLLLIFYYSNTLSSHIITQLLLLHSLPQTQHLKNKILLKWYFMSVIGGFLHFLELPIWEWRKAIIMFVKRRVNIHHISISINTPRIDKLFQNFSLILLIFNCFSANTIH